MAINIDLAQISLERVVDSIHFEGTAFEALGADLKACAEIGYVSARVVEWGLAREFTNNSWHATEATHPNPAPKAIFLSTNLAYNLRQNPDKADGTGRTPSQFNPFKYDLLFVPCHDRGHWNLAVVIKPWRLIRSLAESKETITPPEFRLSRESGRPPASKKIKVRHDGSPAALSPDGRRISLLDLAKAEASLYALPTVGDGLSNTVPVILWLDSQRVGIYKEDANNIGRWLQRAALRLYSEEVRDQYQLMWADGDVRTRNAISTRLPMPTFMRVTVPNQGETLDCAFYVVHFAGHVLRKYSEIWPLIETEFVTKQAPPQDVVDRVWNAEAAKTLRRRFYNVLRLLYAGEGAEP